MKHPITNETLNAFVDQQLTPAEMEEIFGAAREDTELAQRICEVRQLKSLIRHAYDGIEPARTAQSTIGRSRGVQALAASLLLGLGMATGWSLHPSGSILPPQLAQGGQLIQASQISNTHENHIILHLDSDDAGRMAAVLDYADQILDNAKKQGVDAQLEIVANSYGLNLLRLGHTPYLARINALAGKHANLSFVACGQTVARFQRDGQEVRLIEQARLAPSAIGEVVSRMQEGWTYIRV